MIIYCVQNVVTGRKYIGFSTRYNSEEELQKSRMWGHGTRLGNSVNKHGKSNFKRWVLLKNIFDFEELKRYEILWIKKLKTKKPFGYNLTDGGEGVVGCNHIFHSGNKGKKFSKEWKQNLKDAFKTRKIIKICIICDKIFVSKSGSKTTCSTECKKEKRIIFNIKRKERRELRRQYEQNYNSCAA